MKVKSESEVAQSCPSLTNPMDWGGLAKTQIAGGTSKVSNSIGLERGPRICSSIKLLREVL